MTVYEANSFRYDPSDFGDFAEPDISPLRSAVEIPLSSNGRLDLRSLRVSPRVKYLIQHGDSIGQYPSRSEALFAVIMALVGAGYDDHDISSLCLRRPTAFLNCHVRKAVRGWRRSCSGRAARQPVSAGRLKANRKIPMTP